MKHLFTMVLLAVLCLAGSMEVKATNVYFTPSSNWKVDNARFAAYYWDANGNHWCDFENVVGNTYKATIDDSFDNLIICRMNPNNKDNNWDNKWNQTADLVIPSSCNPVFIPTEGFWDGDKGSWWSTEVTISDAGYSTFYTSVAAYTMPEGMTGYIFDKTSNNIVKTYEAGDVVPADEALVVKGKGKYTLYYTYDAASKKGSNELKGTDVTFTPDNDENSYFYALSLNAEGDLSSVGFYWVSDGGAPFVVPANKAYLQLDKTPGAKVSYVFNEGEVDGINVVGNTLNGNAPIYNVAGQRVSMGTKGILIQNGRKFINK